MAGGSVPFLFTLSALLIKTFERWRVGGRLVGVSVQCLLPVQPDEARNTVDWDSGPV